MYIHVHVQFFLELHLHVDMHTCLPNGRYIPDIQLLVPFSPLYPDTVILISLQGEPVTSFNCNT